MRGSMSRTAWALVAPVVGLLTAAGCSGASGGPTGGAECATSADCGSGEACVSGACQPAHGPDAGPDAAKPACGGGVMCGGACCSAGQTCQDGACVTPHADAGEPPPVCKHPGQSCTGTNDCCTSESDAPLGQVCISDDGACHAKCTSNSQCTSGCCATVKGESYGVCAAASYCAPTTRGVGDACSSNAQCSSGDCTGLWCTEACSPSNSVCAGGYGTGGLYNYYGHLNWCVVNGGGTDTCFPGCTTSADCAPYSGTVCRAVTDVNGYSVNICSR